MRVIVPIRLGWGRRVVVQEAIPVRALPFVSLGLPSPLPPSRIASNLAPETLGFEDRAFHDERPRVLTGLRAHQLTEDLRIADVPPLAWDRIYDAITAAGPAEADQLKCLPPGVFVWRRDFERAFDDYRQGFRGLSYDPLIPAELQALVMEGFPWGADRAENPGSPPPAEEPRDDDEPGFHAAELEEYRAEAGTLDADASEDPSADPIPPVLNTEGMVAWQAAALENWDAIEKEHGPYPAARAVLRWLRDKGPRDVFPKEQTQARDTAEWLDGGGYRHTLRLESLSKQMSEWRKWGWIPGRKK